MPRSVKISPKGSAGAAIAIPKGGTSSRWNVFNVNDMSRINIPGNARGPKWGRTELTSGRRQVFRGLGSTFTSSIQLIGWRTLIIDQYASAVLFRALAWQVVKISGERVRDSAINDAPFQDDTGDTRNSMRENDPSMFDSNDVIIAEMGPTTFYSPFLEFGWLKGGVYRSYPFMIPASYKHQDEFFLACIDVATVVANHGVTTIKQPVGNSTTSSIISTARKWLYSRSKALGDITVFTGSRVTGPMRTAMLGLAKELGDLNAIMSHSIGARISTRITGAFTGRALGMTRTISVNKTYSAYPAGGSSSAVGSRVQNRFLGRLSRPAALSGGGIFK